MTSPAVIPEIFNRESTFLLFSLVFQYCGPLIEAFRGDEQGVISMITLAGLIWYKSKGYGGPTVIWSLKAVSQYGRHTLIREGKARTVEGS